MILEELIHDLSQQSSFLLAIDGMSGSGKTTLAHHLAQKFHAQVFHMDDFFLPLEMRTPERLQQSGGNVHYERFLETVLVIYLYLHRCMVMWNVAAIRNKVYTRT